VHSPMYMGDPIELTFYHRYGYEIVITYEYLLIVISNRYIRVVDTELDSHRNRPNSRESDEDVIFYI
jgi:predicted acetyltransferase